MTFTCNLEQTMQYQPKITFQFHSKSGSLIIRGNISLELTQVKKISIVDRTDTEEEIVQAISFTPPTS